MANTVGAQIWTPGSDYTLGSANSQILLTRGGKDSILTYDPGADNSGRSKLDILVGDLEILDILSGDLGNIDLPFPDPQNTETNRDWQDRFILGDWQQAYYIDGERLSSRSPRLRRFGNNDATPARTFDTESEQGLNQFATIIDLDPEQDLIQLHGSPENYVLREVTVRDRGFGTGIFWSEGNNLDLVGFLPSATDLNLNDDLFQFVGNTPPPVSLSEVAEQVGTVGIDLFTGSATDELGNVYVAGASTGTVGESSAGAYDPMVVKYDADGNKIWNLQLGSSNFDWITDIVVDGQNNFYVTGYTEGNLEGLKSAEVSDVWLAKYDSDGNQIWIEQFGTDRTNRSFSIDVDVNGDVYLSGYTVEETRRSQSDDSWVTKYDSEGNRQWFSEFGTRQFDEAYDVAVDNEGNVFSTGWTLGDLGGNNAGVYDVWLAKHDNDGELQFIEQFGTEDYEFAWGVDTDNEGNVYVTGWTLGDIGGTNAGEYDVWLAKYNNDGDRLWIQQFGTAGDDSLLFGGIEVDSNGDILLAGHTDDNLAGANSGSFDAWAAKYNSDGDRLWIQQFGTPDLDYAQGISSDNAGNIYVSGITEGSLGALNAGAADAWVAKLDTDSGMLLSI